MPNITPLSPIRPMVDQSGSMTQETRTWVQLITNLDLIVGSGSPEGVVDASVGRMYMDDTGATGSILYIKRDTDVSGDSTKGWILV